MNGDGTIQFLEDEIVLEELEDELNGFVKFQSWHHLAHTMQTWALVTKNRIFTLVASFPKCLLEFCTLAVGDIEHTLRFPNLSAAHLVHALREDNFITCLVHELNHLIYDTLLHRCTLGQTESLIQAAWEINDLLGLLMSLVISCFLCHETLDVHEVWLGHRWRPKRNTNLMKPTT